MYKKSMQIEERGYQKWIPNNLVCYNESISLVISNEAANIPAFLVVLEIEAELEPYYFPTDPLYSKFTILLNSYLNP